MGTLAGRRPGRERQAWVGEWLGVPVFFSGFDAATNRRLVRSAGLRLVRDESVTMTEPDHGDVTFLWVLAPKPP